MALEDIKPGLTGEVQTEVTPEKTANRIASGIVEVYATPQMIALMEHAAAASVHKFLPAGQSTVGTLVNIKHLAATPIGHTVRAVAELIEVDGKRLLFNVAAYDENEKIGEGQHERFIIDEERFLSRVGKKVKA